MAVIGADAPRAIDRQFPLSVRVWASACAGVRKSTVMSRIQFTLPEHFIFHTDIQIYISHVNQGGHLDNAQLLTLVSEARVRFFKSLGYTESNVAGCPIVVGDLVAQYKSEGFHGETMRVRMTPRDPNKYGFDLVFRMDSLDGGREVARGKVGIVFIDAQSRRVTPVPTDFLPHLAHTTPTV